MVTFSALINIILFSGLSIVLLGVVFRDNTAVLKLDIRFLLTCMLVILFRLLIPIESPLTNNIPISYIYPDIYIFLKEPFMNMANIDISILDILMCIWFAGSIYYMNKVVQEYINLKNSSSGYPKLKEKQILKVVKIIKGEHRRRVSFHIMSCESNDTPIIYGFVKPHIILPKIELNDEELYYILKHEMLHYYRGDLYVKVFCELLRVVYWWNPFVHKLDRLIDNMQEVNIDFSIMKKLSDEKKLDYLDCLVKVAKIRESKKDKSRWVFGFQKESSSAIHKRISLMLQNMDISKRKTVASVLLSLLIVGLTVFCPNVLIFEPNSIAEEDAKRTFDIQEDNVFYLRNQDSSFSLYWDGQYMGIVTELLGEDIKVYNSIEEAERNEESNG